MALKEFVEYMNELSDIRLAAATSEKADDIDKKDKAQAYLEGKGLQTIGSLLPGFNPSTLTPEQRKQYANQGIDLRQRSLNEEAGKTLQGKNLENLLGEINPNSLESLARREEVAKGGVKGYDQSLEFYGKYLGAKDFGERYTSGKIAPDELKGLYSLVAQDISKEVVEKNKGKFSKSTLEAMGNVVKIVVETRGIDSKSYLDKAVKSLITKAEKEFRDYENKSGKKIVNYVRDSLKNMRNSKNTEDALLARAMIYSVAN